MARPVLGRSNGALGRAGRPCADDSNVISSLRLADGTRLRGAARLFGIWIPFGSKLAPLASAPHPMIKGANAAGFLFGIARSRPIASNYTWAAAPALPLVAAVLSRGMLGCAAFSVKPQPSCGMGGAH